MSKTYKELQEQIRVLQAQAEEVRANELSTVIADIKAKIAEYNLTAKDLGLNELSVSTKKAKDKKPAKYRSPEGKGWSGRGRKPDWINKALATGSTLEDFLIKE